MMIAGVLVCASVVLTQAPQSNPQPTEAPRPAPAAKPAPAEQAKQLDLLPIEANLVSYTNAERTRFGLPALEVDKDLMKSARSHASWMAQSRNMVHTRQPVAENIAMGQPHSSQALRDWMGSSGHRANILNRGHRRVGVAAYRTPEGTIYWCQQFRP